MASSFEKLKDLDLSRDEVRRIGEALKQEEFRKLLSEYVEEIQNPDNKKLYEQEIVQLEKERGVDCTFINPKPGYVIKTSVDGSRKCFVNICINDNIKKPSSSPAYKEGNRGLQWSLPHTLTPPREDVDNKGERCQVFDVVFHPDAMHMAHSNKSFYHMLNATACDAVEKNFNVKLDRKNLRFPKLQYKGAPQPTIIRKPSNEKAVDREGLEKEFFDKIYAQADANHHENNRKPKKSPRKKIPDDKSCYTTPKFLIKHRSHADIQECVESKDAKLNVTIPKELIIEINLPLLRSSSDITLDVTEKTVQLVSEKPSKYKLNLTLPYRVNQDSGNAKFDKDLKKLIVVLPVKRNVVVSDYCRDDSGVDSDHNSPATPESEDDSSENKPVISEAAGVTDFRTNPGFLDASLHYSLPEFTCHLFDSVLAFTLNVKNVDDKSVSKVIGDAGSSIHVKLTSVGSSFYPVHFAFYAQLPSRTIREGGVTVEIWDNNVVLQIPFEKCDTDLVHYYYGLHKRDLKQKFIEEPSIVNSVLESTIPEEPELEQNPPNNETVLFKLTENTKSVDEETKNNNKSKAINILGTSYESSGDELSGNSFSPSKSKESSLDDYVVCSSFEMDSAIPEDGELSTSLKKTVRFNDVIMRQLYRSNSSILGQKKKNQRKNKNKKRALERRHSESEASELEDKKEDLSPSSKSDSEREEEALNSPTEKNGYDIFHMDMNY